MRVTNIIGIVLLFFAVVSVVLGVLAYLWWRKLLRDSAECMVEDVQDQLFIPIRIFNASIALFFTCSIIGFILLRMKI